MQWALFVAVLILVIISVPVALGVAMRLAGIWRGGWRDIGIAAGLSWLTLGLGLIVLYGLQAIGGDWWHTGGGINKAVKLLIVCAVSFTMILKVLSGRGRSPKAALIFVLLLAAMWGATEIADRTLWPNTRIGQVEYVDDDGITWVRMQDGSLVGQRPVYIDGQVLFEQLDEPNRTNH